MLGIIEKLFGSRINYKELMAEGAVIVDVRTAGEYQSGHIPGSKNIPLHQLSSRIKDLKKSGKAVITVCRSGARSGAARGQLKNAGIIAYNGGPWDSLQRKIQ